ncbi:hypothetical protein HHK36_008945 [Tetracentron sinense]|uniref:SMARCC C-terminal domain-containing protein n=1 Tax=Tetracentron sinense TaxID=13715 RepID=A0A835DHW8_TETSI|nr:hypothetical protein HHK36_008945 [Tetracentron sinense]
MYIFSPGLCLQDLSSESRLPFANYGNPVMALVSDYYDLLILCSVTTDRMNSAAKIGLAAAAMKAKLFADHEEREIQRMAASIINHQESRTDTIRPYDEQPYGQPIYLTEINIPVEETRAEVVCGIGDHVDEGV